MEFKIGKTYTFSPADYNAEKDEAHKKNTDIVNMT